MTGTLVARKRNIQCRTKVKTGCATCRIRKVKCDENKPFCQKCVNTGRACDGYESPFRFISDTKRSTNAYSGGIKPVAASLRIIRPNLIAADITAQDVEILGRYFSTKTMFDVKLDCNEEARQILQASLTDPTIRHAVSSLKALRENLETPERAIASGAKSPIGRDHDRGLQQYCMALGGLASKLSSPGPNDMNSALLCCQIFISIEQARGNYAAMAQHMIRGLSIMHEYRARPKFVGSNRLGSPRHGRMPLLDVFIIKLFIAPCRFADPPPAPSDSGGTAVAYCPMSPPPHQQSVEFRKVRTLAPDMRAGLTRIAESALEFLSRVSHVESAANAYQLLGEKSFLLDSLELWLIDLELALTDIGPPRLEPLSLSFLRFFHQVLKIILLGALYSSPDYDSELRTEIELLQQITGNIEKGVKAWTLAPRVSNGSGAPHKAH